METINFELAHRDMTIDYQSSLSRGKIYSRLAILAQRDIPFHYRSSLLNGKIYSRLAVLMSIIDPPCPMSTIYSRLAVVAHRVITFHYQSSMLNGKIYSRLAVVGHRDITFHYRSSLSNSNNLLQTCSIGTSSQNIPLTILFAQWQHYTPDLQYWHIET